ncbi:MAG: amidohydrolase [Peptococcaceae bacterium]|nr:amidohydrolase [Peptococcaceae bacterium]
MAKQKILFRGMILPMTGKGDFYAHGELAIEDGKILSVGPLGSAPQDWRPDLIFDKPGLLAMPGLINGHTHAAMTILRSYADDLPLMEWLQEKIWPFEAKLKGDDIYWGTKLALVEMLLSGTTTMVDMYDAMDRVAEATQESGLRAIISRGMIGTGAGAAKAMQQSIQLIKDWHGKADGRITVMLGPHAPYTCPPEYLQEVIKVSEAYNVGINIHLAETLGEVTDMLRQYGKSPVRLMEEVGLFKRQVVAAHSVFVDDAEIELLAKHRVGVVHNPESNMKLSSGVCPVTKMLAAGVKVGIGTDGASSNNNLDMFGEMRTASLLQKVNFGSTALPAYETLELATVKGAEALGLQNLGQLYPGFKADVIMLDMHQPHLYPRHDIVAHLVYAAHASDVQNVIIDGVLVMENRQVLTLDTEKTMQEVQSRAEDIKQRLAAEVK